MKIIIACFFLLCINSIQAQITNPDYDSTLVKKLGADSRGMKMYVFVMLKTGPANTDDKDFVNKCFAGHMENMGRLVKENLLVVAGPFDKNDDELRGLFILNVSSLEEAQTILESDPAIKAGLLKPVTYKWYGSAALPIYLDSVDKLKKSK